MSAIRITLHINVKDANPCLIVDLIAIHVNIIAAISNIFFETFP